MSSPVPCSNGSSPARGELVSYQRRHDRVRGVEVHSFTAGPHDQSLDGAPIPADIVMVHGLGMSNRYLVPSLRELAVDRRVIAPNLSGVGRGSRSSQQLTMAEIADGLVDWMDTVGVGRAIIIGHSLGCHVVAQLAARHPTRVKAVVLVSPGLDPDRRTWWQGAWLLLRDAPRERPALVLIAARDYLRVGSWRMLSAFREAKRADTTVQMSRITQPTLIIRGDRDPLISGEWAQRLATVLPSGSLTTIARAPHALIYSALEPFVSAVRHFVDDLGKADVKN